MVVSVITIISPVIINPPKLAAVKENTNFKTMCFTPLSVIKGENLTFAPYSTKLIRQVVSQVVKNSFADSENATSLPAL
jgi:hypothetical protein